MADVFISYSKSDRSFALDLAEELRTRGISVWIDQTSIRGAKNWASEIVNAINDCSTVLCLLSPNSIASENVAREVHLASEKRKHILPVMIEKVSLPPTLEYPLAGLQRVYYDDSHAIFHALESLHDLATEAAPPPMEQSGIGGEASPTMRGVVAAREDDFIRVAVLPFDDLSPQHDNQWFADGMMDELISTLGSIENVKVPSRSDVLHYRDHKKRSREIAREIGVRYLIEGGVRKAKDKIRINASLIDTLHSEQIWANKFDGNFDDVFEFQESVSKKIAKALKLKLTPEEKEMIESKPTTNVEAYELYLKGKAQHYLLTKEGYLSALALYEQAYTLDPWFADAFIAHASANVAYFREYSRDMAWLMRAEESLSKAHKISGENATTLWIQGEIESGRGNYENAKRILIHATQTYPSDRRPFDGLGNLYMSLGNYPQAAQAFQQEVEIQSSLQGYFNLLVATSGINNLQLLRERASNLLPHFERYVSQRPDDLTHLVCYGFVLFWAGKKDEALLHAEMLAKNDKLESNALYNLGCLFDELGKPQLNIVFLKKALEKGYRIIENLRNYSFTTRDPNCEREFQQITDNLEKMIEQERSGNPERNIASEAIL